MADQSAAAPEHVLALSAVLEGDASRILELRRLDHSELLRAASALGVQLRFGRPTLLRLLTDWNEGTITDEQVRWWALFMFLGAFPDEWSPSHWLLFGPIKKVDIDYSDDNLVNEIVFRLKDLGDRFNGGISRAERDKIIAALKHGNDDARPFLN